MLELANQTLWPAQLVPGWNSQRQRHLTLVVKLGYRFALDGSLQLLEQIPSLELADRYHGEPGKSSLAAASEIVPFKAGGEFLLSGTAYAPHAGARVMMVEARLRHPDGREWHKSLRISGERRWKKSILAALPAEPQPLEPLPLRYEHAFGGADPKRERINQRNPVGQGFALRGRIANGQLLPQIEQGPEYIVRPAQQPHPAGFGPIPSYWEPRLQEQQGLDLQAVAEGLCPYPSDVPLTLYNAAPQDQRFPRPFQGGEQLALRGFFPGRAGESLRLTLPEAQPQAFVVLDEQWQRVELACDTLSVDTDACTITLLWRAGIVWSITDRRRGRVIVRDTQQQHELLGAAV